MQRWNISREDEKTQVAQERWQRLAAESRAREAESAALQSAQDLKAALKKAERDARKAEGGRAGSDS